MLLTPLSGDRSVVNYFPGWAILSLVPIFGEEWLLLPLEKGVCRLSHLWSIRRTERDRDSVTQCPDHPRTVVHKKFYI